MIKSIRDVRKYVKQQRPAKPGEPVTVRLHPDQLDQLNAWIAKQDDALSRS
jgi:cytochrome c553